MSNKLFETSDIAAIADAIRAKNGSSARYTVSEMATAISNIPSGGGEWELEFFTYLTLNGGTGCKVDGTLTSNYSYYLKYNNLSAVTATIHPFFRTTLSDWRNWTSLCIDALQYRMGNNNGSYESAGLGWSGIKGEHDCLYNGATDTIVFDGGAIGTSYAYTDVTNSNVTEFIIGGALGGSNSFYGQIEEFTISQSGTNLHHYVPASIKHNSTVVDSGLFDTVTNKYYTSSGTATNTKIDPT